LLLPVAVAEPVAGLMVVAALVPEDIERHLDCLLLAVRRIRLPSAVAVLQDFMLVVVMAQILYLAQLHHQVVGVAVRVMV
jgi:hypothetical protein